MLFSSLFCSVFLRCLFATATQPEPLFEHIGWDFVVTFRKYRITGEIVKELSKEEKAMVDYVQKHKRISRRECVELLEVSPTTSYRHLRSLEEKGVIERRGWGENAFYVLA